MSPDAGQPRRARVDRVEAGHALRRVAGGRLLVGLGDVVDDRLAVDRERHRAALVHVRDVLDVQAVVVRPERVVLVVLGRVLEARDLVRRQRGGDVDLAGLEGLHGGRAVGDHPAVDALEADLVGVTPVGVLDEVDASSRAASVASLNGPSVTMFFASVHLSPNCSTAFLLTARNDVWATCWTNHGCGEVSLTCSVCGSSALTPTLSLQRVAVRLAGVVLLRADDAEELVRVVGRELGRDRPLPRVLEVVRGHRIAVRPAPVRAELERDGLAAVDSLPALRPGSASASGPARGRA